MAGDRDLTRGPGFEIPAQIGILASPIRSTHPRGSAMPQHSKVLIPVFLGLGFGCGKAADSTESTPRTPPPVPGAPTPKAPTKAASPQPDEKGNEGTALKSEKPAAPTEAVKSEKPTVTSAPAPPREYVLTVEGMT